MKMSWKNNLILLVLYCFLITYNVNGDRIKDKMYEVIQGAAPCFRRLNATHQIGCSSIHRGSTGVIHIVKSIDDIDWLLKNSSAGPYMPVLEPLMFTKENLYRFKQNLNKISGVILINSTSPNHFSHDSKCPNNQFELIGTCDANERDQWNSYGTDLLYEDFPFPIFFVGNMTYVEMIKDCFEKFNNYSLFDQESRSLCSLELKAFMFGAVSTETCVRRQSLITNLNRHGCDPLGDKNIWSTLFPRGNYSISKYSEKINRTNDQNNGSVILIATRLDTTSMFDGIAPGAVSPISGLVTLLTVASMLKQMFNNSGETYADNVLFLIFNGESYDYIGSQRVVYDMQHGNFPVDQDNGYNFSYPKIDLKDIDLFIELSQLSNITNLFVHHVTYENSESSEMVSSVTQSLKKILHPDINISISNTGKIPPSSLQTFLKANNNTPGIVLTDHLKTYRNQFYNSIFDNANNLNYTYYLSNETIPYNSIQRFLSNVSFAVAKVIYEKITGSDYTKDELYDPVLVNDLMYCYLYSSNCSLFRKATFKENLQEKPLNLYVGVTNWHNALSTVTGFLLAFLTGDRTNLTQEQCHDMVKIPVFQYLWMSYFHNSSGVCVRTTMNFTEAVSPAFIIKDYNWKSGKYSSWSESAWHEISMRMYLKPSAYYENITFFLGTAVLIFSFLIVYFINMTADILFNICQNTVGTQC